jgi:lipopolysaccharide/colanic/teichoic acid biosynthesis glycosyltransferase
MKHLLKRLKKNISSRLIERGVPDICSEETFNFLLRRERARADRCHGVFSLVIFDLCEGRKKESSRRLIEVLKGRIRITDSIGWLSGASVGVLLADAPCEGGKSFSRDVLALIYDIHPAPECHVYTYPAAADENGGDSIFATPADGKGKTNADAVLNEMLALSPSLGRRLVERFIAGIALLLLSPLLLLIAMVIKRASPGPVLFRQWRIGHKGVSFRCLKFRTMHLNDDTTVHDNYFKTLIATDVPMRKLDDPRIFRAGRLLRSSSMDELPQLFNIVRGEMSLVGPRPPISCEYRDYLPWHRHRVDVLPGLTGLWQVSGKNKTTFTEMMRLDVRYARQKSLREDLRIIFKTPRVIITQFMEDHRLVRLFPGLSSNEREGALSRRKSEIPGNTALSNEGK